MTGPERFALAVKLIEDAHTIQHDMGPGCGSEEILTEAAAQASLAAAAASIEAAYASMLMQSTGKAAPGMAKGIVSRWADTIGMAL